MQVAVEHATPVFLLHFAPQKSVLLRLSVARGFMEIVALQTKGVKREDAWGWIT